MYLKVLEITFELLHFKYEVFFNKKCLLFNPIGVHNMYKEA